MAYIGKSPDELYALGRILGIQRIRIFDREVGTEQFLCILVRIGGRRLGAAEMDGVPVARYDCVTWRVLPRAQTLEASSSL